MNFLCSMLFGLFFMACCSAASAQPKELRTESIIDFGANNNLMVGSSENFWIFRGSILQALRLQNKIAIIDPEKKAITGFRSVMMPEPTAAGHVLDSSVAWDHHHLLYRFAKGEVNIFDVATGRTIASHSVPKAFMGKAVISPKATKFVTTSIDDNTASIWDAKSGEKLYTLNGHSDWIVSVNFSPDGEKIVTGARDGDARIWDAATGKLLHVLPHKASVVGHVKFSPDGTLVLSAGTDRKIKIWNVANGDLAGTIEVPINIVGMSVSSSGRYAAFVPDPNGKDSKALYVASIYGGTPFKKYLSNYPIYEAKFLKDSEKIIVKTLNGFEIAQ